ncbi:AMP-binding protein [Amycolatopsis sp. NPDC048633]|uniref:AMP-binding protein n=1 Tax=Amycolatopsis sp. NPDC048633 TaxID=3157095 RepID=UPI0033C2A45D
MTTTHTAVHPLADQFRAEGMWTDRTLIQEWQAVADTHAGREAVVAGENRMTYAELSRATDLIAAGLLSAGAAPGDRALLQLTNRLETVLAWYGVLKAGLVPVCTLAAHRRHEIEEIAMRSGASVHIVESSDDFDMIAFAEETARRIPQLKLLVTVGASAGSAGMRLEDLVEGDAAAARARVDAVQQALDPDGVAVLQLSGGTTGTPKLIPRRHHEYWYNARAYADVLGWDETVRVAHGAPIIHNAGVVCALHAPHSVGGTCVLLTPVGQVVVSALTHERITDMIAGAPLIPLIPLMVASGTIRRVVMSGARPPLGMYEAFDEGGIWAGQLYGMAEGMFVATPLDAPGAARRNSVGVPISPLDEVLVLDPASEERLADGELGELCVRGPYTITAYYDAREPGQAEKTEAHNRRAFTSDGYYRTGDLGVARIEDGYRCFSIEGRIKDVIDRGGEKINVDELEGLLNGHPQIASVAVVPVPDKRLGQRGCAVVVPVPGTDVDLDSIRTYLEGRGVAKFKWPESLHLVDELPSTAVGKVDKKVIRGWFAGGSAAEQLVPPVLS